MKKTTKWKITVLIIGILIIGTVFILTILFPGNEYQNQSSISDSTANISVTKSETTANTVPITQETESTSKTDSEEISVQEEIEIVIPDGQGNGGL